MDEQMPKQLLEQSAKQNTKPELSRPRPRVNNSPSIHTSSTSTRTPDTMDGPTLDSIRHNLAAAEHELEGVPYTPPEVVIRWARPLAAMARTLLDEIDRSTTEHDQPSDQQSDEHFPWHYTEYGVVCACGQPMRNEICPASPATDRQPCDQQSRPVTSVSVREADSLSRPVVSSGSRVGPVRAVRVPLSVFSSPVDIADDGRFTAASEPARCEHGKTEAHPISCDSICDASGGGSCFTPWCACRCHRGPCRGPEGER